MARDAVIIGGGFFGSFLALFLSRRFRDLVVLEREDSLLARASFGNQARLHNGYHYPRSFQTAARSHLNVANFVRDFPESVVRDFSAYYCVASQHSKVSPGHFERFCRRIGCPLRPAPAAVARLFSPRLVAAVYEVEEFAFDSHRLRDLLAGRLAEAGVEVRTGARVEALETVAGEHRLVLASGERVAARWVFNCTYAGLNHVRGIRPQPGGTLKQQMVEIALLEVPPELERVAVTVVDGPFFGIMPFPALGRKSLYHVRYSPHFEWLDAADPAADPYEVLRDYDKISKFPFMIRDAARYLPILSEATHLGSLFEIRTLLTKTVVDDARPILLDRPSGSPRVISLLGGKMDNIYDLFDALERELD